MLSGMLLPENTTMGMRNINGNDDEDGGNLLLTYCLTPMITMITMITKIMMTTMIMKITKITMMRVMATSV